MTERREKLKRKQLDFISRGQVEERRDRGKQKRPEGEKKTKGDQPKISSSKLSLDIFHRRHVIALRDAPSRRKRLRLLARYLPSCTDLSTRFLPDTGHRWADKNYHWLRHNRIWLNTRKAKRQSASGCPIEVKVYSWNYFVFDQTSKIFYQLSHVTENGSKSSPLSSYLANVGSDGVKWSAADSFSADSATICFTSKENQFPVKVWVKRRVQEAVPVFQLTLQDALQNITLWVNLTLYILE